MQKLPKRKIDKFLGKIRNARSIKELKKAIDNLFSYSYINSDIEGLIYSIEYYILLNELDKAKNIISYLKNLGYSNPILDIYEARIMLKTLDLDGLNKLEKIWGDEKINPEIREKAFLDYLIYSVNSFGFIEKAINSLKEFGIKTLEDLKKIIISSNLSKTYIESLMEVYTKLKKYQEAKEFIKEKKLDWLLKKIKEELKNYDFQINYYLDYDNEDPTKDLIINVFVKGISEEKLKEIEDKLIDLVLDINERVFIYVNGEIGK